MVSECVTLRHAEFSEQSILKSFKYDILRINLWQKHIAWECYSKKYLSEYFCSCISLHHSVCHLRLNFKSTWSLFRHFFVITSSLLPLHRVLSRRKKLYVSLTWKDERSFHLSYFATENVEVLTILDGSRHVVKLTASSRLYSWAGVLQITYGYHHDRTLIFL